MLEDIQALAKEAKLNGQALINRIVSMAPEKESEFSPEVYTALTKRLSDLNKLLDKLCEDHLFGW